MSSIDHPDHYKGNGMETIDVIDAFDLSFELGNVIKYITRAGKKGSRYEDLLKARWYLEREINNIGSKDCEGYLGDIAGVEVYESATKDAKEESWIDITDIEKKCGTCGAWHREPMCGGLEARYGLCKNKNNRIIKLESASCDDWRIKNDEE